MAPKPEKESMVQRLTRLLDAEEDRLKLEKDPDARQVATRTVVMLCSELRKAESADFKRASGTTKASVVEFFRAMDPIDGARFWKEIGRMFEKKSGLA